MRVRYYQGYGDIDLSWLDEAITATGNVVAAGIKAASTSGQTTGVNTNSQLTAGGGCQSGYVYFAQLGGCVPQQMYQMYVQAISMGQTPQQAANTAGVNAGGSFLDNLSTPMIVAGALGIGAVLIMLTRR